MKLEFSRQIFVKYSNIKFHEILSSGSRVVPWWLRDMSKVIVAFRNFANAPKNDDDDDDDDDEDDDSSNNKYPSWMTSDIKLTGA